jgi:hypothetical protein
MRIARRPIDRLISVVWPQHRYRCRVMDCGWEGNLRVERGRKPERYPALTDADQTAASPPDPDARLPVAR